MRICREVIFRKHFSRELISTESHFDQGDASGSGFKECGPPGCLSAEGPVE